MTLENPRVKSMQSDAIEEIRQVTLVSLNEAVASLPIEACSNSVRKFIVAACSLGPLDHYKHFSQAARRVVDDIRALGGPETVRTFLVAAVKQSLIDLIDGGTLERLPPRAYRHHLTQLRRIATSLPDKTRWLDVDDDLFQKDFGLVTLRLYAAAAQLIDFRCGIPRSIVVRDGYLAAPAKVMTLLRLGGYWPFFQIHTHLSYLEEFNEDGWDECYLTCCDLYKRHPTVLGMYGSSWFYDPKLETISPRLRYLRNVPASGKAMFWLAETEGHFVQDAISTSPSRRQLYDQGKYHPRSFMMLWSKRDQMRWAENIGRQSKSSGKSVA